MIDHGCVADGNWPEARRCKISVGSVADLWYCSAEAAAAEVEAEYGALYPSYVFFFFFGFDYCTPRVPSYVSRSHSDTQTTPQQLHHRVLYHQ